MQIHSLQVGPIGTNCYLLCDEEAGVCAVIDPGGEAGRIRTAVENTGCKPCGIFLTHGHYDHTGAADELRTYWPEIPVYLNRRDRYEGDAYALQLFPRLAGEVRDYDEGDTLAVGDLTVTVLALFAGSCGRTDFLGGSMHKMMASLRRLGGLEGDLKVYPGHMGPSTLDRERRWNPYLLQAMGERG